MNIRPKSLTLRIRLDDIISDGREVQILENLRYCKTMLGKAFDVTLWHEDVEEKELKRFIKENIQDLKVVKGGDNNWSELILIPRKKYAQYFGVDTIKKTYFDEK